MKSVESVHHSGWNGENHSRLLRSTTLQTTVRDDWKFLKDFESGRQHLMKQQKIYCPFAVTVTALLPT